MSETEKPLAEYTLLEWVERLWISGIMLDLSPVEDEVPEEEGARGLPKNIEDRRTPINIIDRKALIYWASMNETELWDRIKKEILCVTDAEKFNAWYENVQRTEYLEKLRLELKEARTEAKVRFYERRIKEMTDAKALFEHFYGLSLIYEQKKLDEMQHELVKHERERNVLEEKVNQSMNSLDTTRENYLLIAHSDSSRSLENLIFKMDKQKVKFVYIESPIYTEKFLDDLSKIQDSHEKTFERYKNLSEKNLENQVKMYRNQNSSQNVQTKIQAWNLLNQGHNEEFQKLVGDLKNYLKDMVEPKLLRRNQNFEEVKQELEAFEPFKLKENVVKEKVWLRTIDKLRTDLNGLVQKYV